MALKFVDKNETFDVVLRIDSALDMTKEQYDEYLKTCDKNLLKFIPGEEPTYFVMRKVLPMKLAMKVQDSQLQYKDGEVKMNMSFIFEDVRCSLVDIKNPASVPQDQWLKFEKDSDGGASKTIIEQLINANVVLDLYAAKNNQMSALNSDIKKK